MVPCRCRGVLLYHAECAGFVKMEISASGIFRVEPFQHRLCGDLPSADGGNVPRPAAGQEGRHQGFYPLNSHFLLFLSLAQTRDRRPLRKRGTTEDFSSHKDGPTSGPSFSFTYSQFGYPTATHIGYSAQAICVAVRCLRTANISRKTRCGNPTAVPLFRSGRRSLVCAGLRNKRKWELRG